jgi:ethanolamine utilization protein EutQ (cupin superfamily)
MEDFPAFMKCSANRIATSSQATPGVEGYVFEGAEGSQMAFWTCRETTISAPHVHDYDEYMVVVLGCYTLIVDGRRMPIKAGEEYFIQRGSRMAGKWSVAPGRSTRSAAIEPRGFINRRKELPTLSFN